MAHDQEITPQTEQATARLNPLIVGSLVVLFIIALVLWFTRSTDPEPMPESIVIEEPVIENVTEDEPKPEPVAEPEPVIEPEPAPEPEPQIEPVRPLPSLDGASEALLSEAIESNINVGLIESQDLVRQLVVLVDNMANGVVVREAAFVAGPESRFLVREIDRQLYIDERSYQRYDDLVNWFVSLDAESVVRLYQRYEPLFEEAYREIGEPNTRFRDRVLVAIQLVLDTPEPTGLLALADDQVMYTFADPALEELHGTQKQMLRIGPDNRVLVKTKLRDIRTRLRRL